MKKMWRPTKLNISKWLPDLLRLVATILLLINIFTTQLSKQLLLLSIMLFLFLSCSLEGIAEYKKGQHIFVTINLILSIGLTILCLFGIILRPWE